MTAPRVFAALFSFACGLLLMAGLATVVAAADPPALDAGVVETHLDGNGPQVAEPVDAKPIIPDASTDAAGAAETIYEWWRDGKILGAVLLLLYSVILILRAKVAWFKVGYRALASAVAATFLLTVLEAIATGATPNVGMFVVAATTAIALAAKGKGDAKVAA